MRPDAAWVLAAGWIGQAFFFARFFVQWIASERAGRSIVPRSFWWLSIAAAALLSLYTWPRGEPVLLPGFLITGSLAARNLWLVTRRPKGGAGLGAVPFAGIGLAAAAALFASGAFTPRAGLHESPLWLAAGIAGQTLWTSRFLLQWWYAERRGMRHFPRAFWWVSLMGNALLLAYSIHLRDAVYIAGFVPGPLLHVRNLMLSRDQLARRR